MMVFWRQHFNRHLLKWKKIDVDSNFTIITQFSDACVDRANATGSCDWLSVKRTPLYVAPSLHSKTLQWRHNGHDSVSNHQPHDCLLNRLFRRISKKTFKLRVTGLCAGNSPGTGEFPANSPGTGEFPAQMASNGENVSIWWRHHEIGPLSTHIEQHFLRDDVIKWKHFPRYWSFVRRILQSWFPSKRPVTRSFDVFFDRRLNKRLSKQSRCRWFETPSRSLWRRYS